MITRQLTRFCRRSLFILGLVAFFGMGLVPSVAQAQEIGGLLWQRTETSWVLAVAVSADGGRIAIGSRSNLLEVLDRSGQVLWSYPAGGSVRGVDLSANGQWLAAASEDRNLYFFSGAGKLLWQAKAPRSFNHAAVADDGSLIAATADDLTLYVYDAQGQSVWTYQAGDEIRALAIYGTGDQARVVTGSNDATVRVFDRNGRQLLQGAVDQDVESLAVTPTGSRIAVASLNRKVYLLDGSNANVLWTTPLADDLHSLAISGDGQSILVGVRDGTAVLLNATGKITRTIPVGAEVLSVAVARDGSTFALGTTDNQALVIDARQANLAQQQAVQLERQQALGVIGGFLLLLVGLAGYLRLSARGQATWARQSTSITSLASEIWRHRGSYLLLLPTLALLLTFNYYPAASALYHAFTEWEPGVRTTWVGLDNFTELSQDQYFHQSITNIIIFVITSLLKTFTVPLLVAELIFGLRSQRVQYWWRTAFVIPLVVPGVALTLIWRNIFDPNIGLLNESLNALGLVDLTRAWLGEPSTALGSLIFVGFPWAAAFPILIFYGGLISIPMDLFDAARVDGASFWHRFWSVDLPLLTSQFRLLLILGFVSAVETFELVFLTTGGGPGSSTYTPALELYYAAIRFNKMGLAAAIGLIMFVVVLAGTLVSMRFLRSAIEYEA